MEKGLNLSQWSQVEGQIPRNNSKGCGNRDRVDDDDRFGRHGIRHGKRSQEWNFDS
jgi:hypothetical protein